jgi:hypothetical protein
MANTYTPRVQLAMPAPGDRTWNAPVNGNAQVLDALSPVGALAVGTAEVPSATLNVRAASGSYVAQDGTIAIYAGLGSMAIPASSTRALYLDLTASGNLVVAAAYPTTAHVRLATVATTSSVVSSITDNRQAFTVAGSYLDGVNLTFGSSTGTRIGSTPSQKLGLWGVTPVVQPSGAAQAALTNSTGGTIGTTLTAVGNTTSSDQSAVINGNIASLWSLVSAIRAGLVASGNLKGSA